MKCIRCGIESSDESTFQQVRVSFRRRTKTMCPRCAQQRALAEQGWSSLALMLLLGAMVLIYWLQRPNDWGVANIAMTYVLLHLSVIPHELGHALGARLMGMQVQSICFGMGRRVYEWNTGRTIITLRLLPFSGFVSASSRTATWIRSRWVAVSLAGPLANAAMLLFSLVANGSQEWFGKSWASGSAFWQALAIANAIPLARSLLPLKGETEAGVTASDVVHAVRAALSPRASAAKYAARSWLYPGYQHSQDNRFDRAVECFESGLALCPSDPYLRGGLAYACIMKRDFVMSRQILFQLVNEDPSALDGQIRPLLLNNLAWTDLMLGTSDLVDEAERLTADAMQAAPHNVGVRGTRACVLIERGHLDAGMQMLRQVMEEHTLPQAKAACAAFLALGEWRSGRGDKAEQWLEKARALDRCCHAIPRVEREMHSSVIPVKDGPNDSRTCPAPREGI